MKAGGRPASDSALLGAAYGDTLSSFYKVNKRKKREREGKKGRE